MPVIQAIVAPIEAQQVNELLKGKMRQRLNEAQVQLTPAIRFAWRLPAGYKKNWMDLAQHFQL